MTPTLRPFFTYFGGKWRMGPHYPAPRQEYIIEPFAGAAGYSVRYPERAVMLLDIDPVVAACWRYLISTPAEDIAALPLVEDDLDVSQLGVSFGAQALIGFWLNRAQSRPAVRRCSWMRSGGWPGSFWGERVRDRIARQVEAIRHWVFLEAPYHYAPPRRATWFIDPPYNMVGPYYRHHALDYTELAKWCRGREGQTIVCETARATWLPFRAFVSSNTTSRSGKSHRSHEAIWTQDS